MPRPALHSTIVSPRLQDALVHAATLATSCTAAMLVHAKHQLSRSFLSWRSQPSAPSGPSTATAGPVWALLAGLREWAESDPWRAAITTAVAVLAGCTHRALKQGRRERRHARTARRLAADEEALARLEKEADANTSQILAGPARARFRAVLGACLRGAGLGLKGSGAFLAGHLRSHHAQNRATALLACRIAALAPEATPPPLADERAAEQGAGPSVEPAAAGEADALTQALSGDEVGSARTCTVCWCEPVDALLAPCGHLCCCLSCVARIQMDVLESAASRAAAGGEWGRASTLPQVRCPVCMGNVGDVLHVYDT